ncbi:MAG TPA: putative metal-binding motif-containing protein, partial [Myxococcota bacterium]|nr:putative metal-binding motif-containing protein [Myxococcota bacterium]
MSLLLLKNLLVVSAEAATLTVGAPYPSISAAIAASSDGDTILIPAGTYSESLDLAGRDLSLVGVDGAGVTWLLPPALQDAVVADQGEVVALAGLSILPDRGRGVVVQGGQVSLSEVVISGAGSSTSTGGACVVEQGQLSLNGVLLAGSVAAQGAGIFAVDATVVAVDLEISGATATTGGGIYADNSELDLSAVLATGLVTTGAGAFGWLQGGRLSLVDFVLEGATNSASDGAGIWAGATELLLQSGELREVVAGGGTSAGGALYAELSTVQLQDVLMGGSEAFYGGGFAFQEVDATLVDVVLADNVASVGGGGWVWGGSLSCTGCIGLDNRAASAGSLWLEQTVFSDTDGVYAGNVSTAEGGALSASDSSLWLDGSRLLDNVAGGDGGGIYQGAGALSLVDVGAYGNRSTGGNGGAVWSEADVVVQGGRWEDNDSSRGSGGALYGRGAVDLSGTRLEGNTAADDGGGLWSAGTTVQLRDVVAMDNIAGGYGGGVALDGAGEIVVSQFYGHHNTASGGGALALLNPVTAATLSNLRASDNVAARGGALYGAGSLQWELRNSTLVGNSATSSAGHVYTTAPLLLVNTILAYATQGGGAFGPATDSERQHNLVWSNSGGDWLGWPDVTGSSGNLEGDPGLVAYTADADASNDDLQLAAGSVCVDAGLVSILDADGSISDIGAFGGPDAEGADGDGDGVLDGADCDDADSAVYPGAPEQAYDGIDQDCDGADLDDVDGDGYGLGL